MSSFAITANFVDLYKQEIYPATLHVVNGKIASVEKTNAVCANYLLPGFIDSHVHVESSLLPPSEFARMAVVHGTVCTVSDPHEIANVCGLPGVEYMMKNGASVPFHFAFGAPSCVPATIFETAGAAFTSSQVDTLLQNPAIYYLSEMMNFPGVLNQEEEVMKKIKSAQKHNKPIDGHAPGLRGKVAKQYITACSGTDVVISTDHECFSAEEALDKLVAGMKILIREGSAARNFEALHPLLTKHWQNMMFCSDDKHPDSLKEGHINQLVARSIGYGHDLFKVLQMACLNPVSHYNLPVGTCRIGDPADFILVSDLKSFTPLETYIGGSKVAENGKSLIAYSKAENINNFKCIKILPEEIALAAAGSKLNVIEAIEGQLITKKLLRIAKILNGKVVSDIDNDVLKLVCVNRYSKASPSVAFIKNFNLKSGALASSVAHDSHNIVAVGVDDESIAKAVNKIIEHKGGLALCRANGEVDILPLPIAGLMSDADGYLVEVKYSELNTQAKLLGCTMQAPFMTLSFMALLVIPHLKLSDKGLFDGDQFKFTKLLEA